MNNLPDDIHEVHTRRVRLEQYCQFYDIWQDQAVVKSWTTSLIEFEITVECEHFTHSLLLLCDQVTYNLAYYRRRSSILSSEIYWEMFDESKEMKSTLSIQCFETKLCYTVFYFHLEFIPLWRARKRPCKCFASEFTMRLCRVYDVITRQWRVRATHTRTCPQNNITLMFLIVNCKINRGSIGKTENFWSGFTNRFSWATRSRGRMYLLNGIFRTYAFLMK